MNITYTPDYTGWEIFIITEFLSALDHSTNEYVTYFI